MLILQKKINMYIYVAVSTFLNYCIQLIFIVVDINSHLIIYFLVSWLHANSLQKQQEIMITGLKFSDR